MSDDFQLTWHPRPISLGDFHLKLDPAIEAQIRVLTAGPGPPTFSPSLRPVALTPLWSMLSPSYLDRLLATPPPTRTSAPLVPRGAGPSVPRPGDAAFALRAVWAVPSVQLAVNGVLDKVTRDLSRGWDHASTAERGLVIGWGVVTAASLSPLLINADTRMGILEFLEGKDIPVPGVSGLSLNIGPRGGGGSWDNFLVPGLGIGGGAQAPKTGESGVQWNARVTFDFAEFFRSRR